MERRGIVIGFGIGMRFMRFTRPGERSLISMILLSREFPFLRYYFDGVMLTLRAVAEAWVASDRKHLYASSSGLGQSFSFDMLMCNYDCKEFKDTITQSLKDAASADGSTTWVFSSTYPFPLSPWDELMPDHDVVRHATRYGIPDAVQKGGLSFASFCREYLKSGGTKPECNFVQGLARARAATLMMLALPGSAYLYQYVPLTSCSRDELRDG
jgi:alpha-glucosidase